MSRTIIFAALLAVCFVFSVWLNIQQHQDKKELETALNATRERIEELKADMRKQADVLAEREQKINILANDKYRLSKRLREAAEHEQEVKLWIDTVVPAPVSGMLKDGTNHADTAATAPTVQ